MIVLVQGGGTEETDIVTEPNAQKLKQTYKFCVYFTSLAGVISVHSGNATKNPRVDVGDEGQVWRGSLLEHQHVFAQRSLLAMASLIR